MISLLPFLIVASDCDPKSPQTFFISIFYKTFYNKHFWSFTKINLDCDNHYCKACDSVKGEKIIELLIDYKIDYWIINSIADIYQDDQTLAEIREDVLIEFRIANGYFVYMYSAGINWKLWTILPRKTTSCWRDLRDFSSFDKMLVHLANGITH